MSLPPANALSPYRSAQSISRGRILQIALAIGLAAWCCLASAAWIALWDHAYQPAKIPDADWARTTLEPADKFRILVFAHPFCPCTRATLHELNESLARLSPKPKVSVVFVSAECDAADVAASDLIAQARQIPGVDVRIDASGREADRFAATVSGETFAFDPAGRLVFHGGLTPSRGHQGDAEGQRRLEQLAGGRSHEPFLAPMYGCRLPSSNSPSPRSAP